MPLSDKEIAMNRKPLALALLLAGAVFAAPSFATPVDYPDPVFHNGDADHDSIPNADDPVDDRYDAAGNAVWFELVDTLPARAVAVQSARLKKPGTGQTWHRLGDNYYLTGSDGVVVDAVYYLRDK